jgi:hypothetical protein
MEIATDDLGQRSAVADDGRNRVDHRLGGDSAERLFPDRRHQQDPCQREVIGRRRHGRRRHDLRVFAEVQAGDGIERSAAVPGLDDEHGDVRATRAQHVRQAREQEQALVRRRVDEGHECARVDGRNHRRPIDGRLDRRADQPYFFAVHVGQKLTAGEGMVDVLEVPRLVVAEAANRKGGSNAALPRLRERREDHCVSVAGDRLVGREIVEETRQQPEELPRLRAIGPRLVVVARQEQRDGHAAHRVVHDGPFGSPSLVFRPLEQRRIGALLLQVLLDGEGHTALEARCRQDAAVVSCIREPLHDRPQALRDAGGRIADAVVIDEQEPHYV